MVAADHAAKALAARTVRTALGVSAAAVLFAVWFAWWLPRVIVRPVAALTRTAQAIGEGNLSVTVEATGVEELEPLAQGFNKMLVRLRAYRESSLGELLAAKDLARATLECLLDPVVVFDREGGVRLANEAAEEAFGLRAGSAEELRAADVRIPAELEDARDRVLATGAPGAAPQPLRGDALARPHRRRARAPLPGPRRAPARRARGRPQRHRGGAGRDPLPPHRRAEERHGRHREPRVQDPAHLPAHGHAPAPRARHRPPPESQRELVTTARDDTERLRAMVEDLLDVVRIESEAGALHRVPVEPFGLLCEVADAHRTVARDKGVTLDVEPAIPHGLIAVDPDRISIALANLVSNAVRHTPSGGKVTLGASRDERQLRVTVRDDGEGIAPRDLSSHLRPVPLVQRRDGGDAAARAGADDRPGDRAPARRGAGGAERAGQGERVHHDPAARRRRVRAVTAARSRPWWTACST